MNLKIKTTEFETDKKPLIIRRCIFAAIILVVAVLQNTGIFPPRIFSVATIPLLPLAVCISMFERSWFGVLMGIVAGVFCDTTLAGGDGFFAIYFAIICFLTSVLITRVMRNNFLCALLIGSVACVGGAVIYWLKFYVAKGYGFSLIFSYYLPSAIYAIVFIPVFYFIIRAIFGKYLTEKI